MRISLNPNDYVGRSQDGVWDVALEAALREVPEESRAEFISRILVLQEKAGLGRGRWFQMARRLLTSPRSYEQLLRGGLAVADASSIEGWLECCVQKIGMRRIVHILRQEDAAHPQRVDLATYWLPRLARTPKEQAIVTTFLHDRASFRKDQT